MINKGLEKRVPENFKERKIFGGKWILSEKVVRSKCTTTLKDGNGELMMGKFKISIQRQKAKLRWISYTREECGMREEKLKIFVRTCRRRWRKYNERNLLDWLGLQSSPFKREYRLWFRQSFNLSGKKKEPTKFELLIGDEKKAYIYLKGV